VLEYLDGALQWEYQQDPHGPHLDSWSMSAEAGSDESDLLERESHGSEQDMSTHSASKDDAVSTPRTGPGSPMGEIEER
jgi:hypothetical protein